MSGTAIAAPPDSEASGPTAATRRACCVRGRVLARVRRPDNSVLVVSARPRHAATLSRLARVFSSCLRSATVDAPPPGRDSPDYLGRPCFQLCFDALEVHSPSSSAVVHAEEGPRAEAVFLNDSVALLLLPGAQPEERPFRRVGDAPTAAERLLAVQVLNLPPGCAGR